MAYEIDYDIWIDRGIGGPLDDDSLPAWADEQVAQLALDNQSGMADDAWTQAMELAAVAVWWARSGISAYVACENCDHEIRADVPQAGSNAERIDAVARSLYAQMLAQMPDQSYAALVREASIETDDDGCDYLAGITEWTDQRDAWTWGVDSSDVTRPCYCCK